MAEPSLVEIVSRRSLSDVESFLDSRSDRGPWDLSCIDDLKNSFKTFDGRGATLYLRELAALMKERRLGLLERCVIEEMISRGFDRESSELRIFRSLVEDSLHDQVITFGVKIALSWEIRPDWAPAMAEAVRHFVGGAEGETALERACFVLDSCSLATLRLMLETKDCLAVLLAPLKAAHELTSEHLLIWNYSVAIASLSDKQQAFIARSQALNRESLYDDILTFFMEESREARLALSTVIVEHPDVTKPARLDSGILLVMGFCCWLPDHRLPEALVADFAKRKEAFGTIRLMLDGIRRNGEDGRAYLRDLLDHMADLQGVTLGDLGLRAEVGLLDTTAEVLAALAQIREAGLPANRRRLVDLVSGLVKNDQLEAAVRICDEESECLLADLPSARAVAEVYTAAKDWQQTAQTWARIASLSPGLHWPLSNAFRAYAQAGNGLAAADIAEKINLADKNYRLALPMLAHSACILGMFDFAISVLEQAKRHFDGYSSDHRRLLGRVQTFISGDLSLVEMPKQDLSQAAAPRALVIDPGFHSGSGHHFNYGLFSVEFLSRNLGVSKEDVWLLTGRDRNDRQDRSLEQSIKQVFRFNPYDFNRLGADQRAVKNLNEAFFQDLLRLSKEIDLSACKVIYVHSMRANMIGGFARWLEKILDKRRIAVIVGIIEVDYLLAPAAERALWSRANRRGINRLFALPGLNPLVYCETQRAWSHFRNLIGEDLGIHQLPYLAASLAGRVASKNKRSLSKETITFGTIGSSTPNRGSDLFPSLVQRFAHDKRVNWVLQLDQSYVQSLGSEQVQFLDQAVRNGSCAWYADRLSVEDYYDAMKRMDVIILPYRDRYAVSGSGVFYEAIQLERFVIVPKQTFMGKVVKEMDYPSRLMGEVSIESATAAISTVLERSEQFRNRVNRFHRLGRQQLPIERFRALFWKTLQALG